MRNHFFPSRKAEYMTRARFAELGLTKNDVGERDFTFRPALEQEELFFDDAVDAIANGGALPAGVNAFAPALEAPKRQPAMEVEQLAVSLTLGLGFIPYDGNLLTRRLNCSRTVPSNS